MSVHQMARTIAAGIILVSYHPETRDFGVFAYLF